MTNVPEPTPVVRSTRRGLLAAGTGFIASLAGCGGGGESGNTAADPSEKSSSPTATSTATPTPTATSTPTPTATEPEEVVVDVGPDGEYRFSPGTNKPIRIPPGTTLRFVWRSDGHNIAVRRQPDDASWSGYRTLEEKGFEYSHTFDVAGKYEFWCYPHRKMGMIGGIVVD